MNKSAREYPSARQAWTAVLVLSLLFVLSSLDRTMIVLIGSSIQEDLGISDLQLSLLYGLAFALFYAIAAVPLGWAIDRFSRRRVIYWCVTFWSIATASCGLASSFGTLFTARAAVGVGEAGLSPGAQSILSEAFPPGRSALPLAVYSFGGKGGQALSLVIGGLLISLISPNAVYMLPFAEFALKGWNLIFILLGLPGLLMAFLVYAFPEPVRSSKNTKQQATFGAYLDFFRQHRTFLLCHHAATILLLATSNAISSWAPMFLQRHHALSQVSSGTHLGTALLLGAAIGMPVHAIIADRLFRRGVRDAHLRYLCWTTLLAIPFAATAFTVADPTLSIALIGVLVAVLSGYISLPVVALQLIAPDNVRGKAASVTILLAAIGGTAGPLMVGSFTDFLFEDKAKIGLSLMLTVLLLLPLSALLLALSLRHLREALRDVPS